MRKIITIPIGLILFLFMLQAYAIAVRVKCPSSNISALGFSVNGSKYGAAGNSYVRNGMPQGTYKFGVRVNGLFGTDVPCYSHGKKAVTLGKDTTAVLNYNGQHCNAIIY